MGFPFKKIEAKWQKRWNESGLYKTDLSSLAKKCYTLVMFIYPSSDKMHLGHWFNYAPTDTWARFRRLRGYNVFEPMGFDSFGLPAENYAIKTGGHPQDITDENIKIIRDQLKDIGAMYDWDKQVVTSHDDYYKWTQWVFLQLYKAKLAYRANAPVNWCESCNTVLANEQVTSDGDCERCKNAVIRKNLTQWFFKITEYAERLLNGLKDLDWPERTKLMQNNWIGKSVGVEINFHSDNGKKREIKVFTTRPDTLFGVTYMVLAPEHPLVQEITTPAQKSAVLEYIEQAMRTSEIDRTSTTREKTGVFTGAFAINPVNGERVPIWISDYVLLTYGTGAVMAVPAHDERDFAFATTFNLPIKKVILEKGKRDHEPLLSAFTEPGIMINSKQFNGMDSQTGKEKVADWLDEAGMGERKINYKLRDWLLSRQRYWGAPIPIIHCPDCGEVPVPDAELPVKLPYDVDFKPTGDSPLASSSDFLNTTCPSCGAAAKREVDTMDTFVDSSWYFLRFLSPELTDEPFSKEISNNWCPVDMYVGGPEHATMHLLYARFITMVLKDLGHINFEEPFKALRHQGMIKGPDGMRMSKSRGNVINPDLYLEKYGSDVFRCYLMFGFEFEKGGPWSEDGIAALDRFLNRIARIYSSHKWVFSLPESEQKLAAAEKELNKILHRSLKGVTEDTERFHFNTAISRLMELVNGIYKYTSEKAQDELNGPFLKNVINTLNVMLAPFAPHFSEELWEMSGHTESVCDQPWPEYDEKALQDEEVNYGILVNGKVRAQMLADANLAPKEIEKMALQFGRIPELLEGKTIRKIVVVPKKIVNIVAN